MCSEPGGLSLGLPPRSCPCSRFWCLHTVGVVSGKGFKSPLGTWDCPRQHFAIRLIPQGRPVREDGGPGCGSPRLREPQGEPRAGTVHCAGDAGIRCLHSSLYQLSPVSWRLQQEPLDGPSPTMTADKIQIAGDHVRKRSPSSHSGSTRYSALTTFPPAPGWREPGRPPCGVGCVEQTDLFGKQLGVR